MEGCVLSKPVLEINRFGAKIWSLDGKPHRADGPAYEYVDGSKSWYVDGKRHRTDGPAFEGADGSKEWYLNNKLHRTDGPAIEFASGSKFWYVDGKRLTESEFNTRKRGIIRIN